MESKIAGHLKPNEHDTNFFESQPFEIPYFDNKKLTIGFVDAEDQSYIDSANNVLRNFLKLNSGDKINDSAMVHAYYSQTLKHEYIKPLNIVSPEDTWNFITPTEIIIHWDEVGDFYLCISCECEWEQEHGLQLVFKNGQTLTRASGHDGHFTD